MVSRIRNRHAADDSCESLVDSARIHIGGAGGAGDIDGRIEVLARVQLGPFGTDVAHRQYDVRQHFPLHVDIPLLIVAACKARIDGIHGQRHTHYSSQLW